VEAHAFAEGGRTGVGEEVAGVIALEDAAAGEGAEVRAEVGRLDLALVVASVVLLVELRMDVIRRGQSSRCREESAERGGEAFVGTRLDQVGRFAGGERLRDAWRRRR